MPNFFVLDKDGKPMFTGKEDSSNPPPRPSSQSSKMECPQCHNMVDYLLGNTRQGCEGCYDKTKDEPDTSGDNYDQSKEIA